MVDGMITAALIIGIVGILTGLFLGIAGIQFKVEVDEREEAVLAALPGNHCGGCGYPGCSGLATAIVKGEAAVDACPVGGKAVGASIAQIMGVEARDSEQMVAFVHCQGDCEKTHEDYDYCGVEDCRMMSFVPGGGPKSCNSGCLGYGSCVKACPFDAIHIVDGIAKVDKEACKACKKCIAACPKNLIELVPYEQAQAVQCGSKDKGQIVKKGCQVGCIGCTLCTKVCETGAITVTDNLAHIDPEKCTNCGKCMEKCPVKIIRAQ